MEHFHIDIPQQVLDDLRHRLVSTRFVESTPGEPWDAGTNVGYLRDLVTYWAEGYDWREAERRLNDLPQYTTRIAGQLVHYVHVRGDGGAPTTDAQWGERVFPRSYAERTYRDLRFWNELPRGGHFTVKQTPDLVAADMREFFRPLRP